MDKTEDNLSRVEDILYDLEGRVEPLREKAALQRIQTLIKEMEKKYVLVTVHDIKQYMTILMN